MEFLKDKRGAGLFYEMGLGKTVIMLEHIKRMKKPFPVLIVCPNSVVSVWAREVNKFQYPFSVTTLIGTVKERLEKLKKTSDIFIINYEGLRLIQLDLLQKNFKTIILDESHRAKERSSQQTSVCLRLSETAENKYILSGTPIAKSPEDLWAQIQFISAGYLGNFYAFRARYVDYKKIKIRVPGGIREIQKPVRFKNLQELEEKLRPIILRRTKKECLDLPEKIYRPVYVDLTKEQKNHYYTMKHSLITQINNNQLCASSASVLVQKLQQICQGFLYDEAGQSTNFPSGKLNCFLDLLKDLTGEKVIVFTYYKNDIERLLSEIKDRKVFVFDGSSGKRAEIEAAFEACEEDAIFLSNVDRAKEGITLTSASNVVYYGNSWSHVTRKQSEDRAHRIGQTRTVVYHDLVVPNTVDELMHDSLKVKEVIADKITGDSIRIAAMIAEQE